MNSDHATKRLPIMETLWRYAEAADAGDYATVSQAFTPNGQMIAASRVLTGRQMIHETLHGLYLAREGNVEGNFQRHHVTTSKIDFTSDTSATGTIYVLVITERGLDHSARYFDKYELSVGQFLIAERTIELDWITVGSRFASFSRRPTT
jgi:hypothetical protein